MLRYHPTYKPRSVRKIEKNTKRKILFLVAIFLIFIYLLFFKGLPLLIGGLLSLKKAKPSNPITSVSDQTALAPPQLNIPFDATNSSTLIITGYASADSKVSLYLNSDIKNSSNTNDTGFFSADPIILSKGENDIYGVTSNDQRQQSLPSKTIKIFYSDEKPVLNLTSPSDGQQIKGGDKKITVSGSTDSTNNILINNTSVIVNSDGNFSQVIPINEGDNSITISATNTYGNTTQITRKVNYSP